jgi:hypothetical protein
MMIAGAVNAKALQTVMGHVSIAVTLDTYGHLMPGTGGRGSGAGRGLPDAPAAAGGASRSHRWRRAGWRADWPTGSSRSLETACLSRLCGPRVGLEIDLLDLTPKRREQSRDRHSLVAGAHPAEPEQDWSDDLDVPPRSLIALTRTATLPLATSGDDCTFRKPKQLSRPACVDSLAVRRGREAPGA